MDVERERGDGRERKVAREREGGRDGGRESEEVMHII